MQMYTKVRYAASVGELRDALKNLPAETIVIQSCDAEGNSFLPLMGIESGVYSTEHELVLSADNAAILSDARPVVCLWPAHDWQQRQAVTETQHSSHKKK